MTEVITQSLLSNRVYVRGVIYYDESMKGMSDSKRKASRDYSQSDNTKYLEVATQEIEGLIVEGIPVSVSYL